MDRRGMWWEMIWFNCLVLVLSLNVSIDIYPFRNPAKEQEIDKDGNIDRGNLNETDEIEVVGKGEINQRLNFWERCELSAILTTNVMGNGI
jgi:hypothetical protein